MTDINHKLQIILMQMTFYMKYFRKKIIHKRMICPGKMDPSQETGSIWTGRGTLVAAYSQPGITASSLRAYYPSIADLQVLLTLSVS